MCGRNLQGQLGLGDPEQFPKNERLHPFQPTLRSLDSLHHKNVVQVALGGEHTVMVCDDNDVMVAGQGGKGQLGTGGVNSHFLPFVLPYFRESQRSVLQVACGNNSTLILTGWRQPKTLQRRYT